MWEQMSSFLLYRWCAKNVVVSIHVVIKWTRTGFTKTFIGFGSDTSSFSLLLLPLGHNIKTMVFHKLVSVTNPVCSIEWSNGLDKIWHSSHDIMALYFPKVNSWCDINVLKFMSTENWYSQLDCPLTACNILFQIRVTVVGARIFRTL